MWHEARKQERRIRGLIVDFRKRAERRQDFYEKIQADPTQFIQIHGRRCRIHLDAAVAAAGDGAAIIVPWQGQQENLIDRFDVRAHLDYIPPVLKSSTGDAGEDGELTQEERQLNYERYRILAQNDFLNVTEDKYLQQLLLEEQFGANAQLEAERNLGKKKQPKATGAAIGYSYDDTAGDACSSGPQPFGHLMGIPSVSGEVKEGSEDSDSDMDMDVSIDIVKLDTAQAHELNACGRNYGMKSNDFYSYLTKDADEADALRIAREEEQEKMLLSGRKSRRERRAQKERRIASRPFSPPSYAAKEEKGKKDNEEDSESRSPSPADIGPEKITYITSFGGEDELQPHSKITISLNKPGQTLGESCISASSGTAVAGHISYAQKVKDNLEKLKQMNESAKRTVRHSEREHSRSRSHSRNSRSTSRSRRRRSRRRSYYRRSKSRSGRRHRYSRSSSHSRRRHRRSRTRSGSRKRYSSSSSSGSSSRRSRRDRRYRSRSVSSQRNRVRPSESIPSKRKTPPISAMERKPLLFFGETSAQSDILPKPTTSLAQAPPSMPQMISYPLPARVLSSMNTSSVAMSSTAPSTSVPISAMPQVIEPPPPPLKRYYGRKRGDGSSSSSSESSAEMEGDKKAGSIHGRDGDDSEGNLDVDTTSERSNPLPSTSSSTTGNQTGKYSSATEIKGASGSGSHGRMNLRERLKKKMQNLLNRQYKADKRAEIEKTERERQMQQEREDEMRELALKLRRRQREIRHKYGTPSSGKNSGSEEAVQPSGSKKLRRSKSRSIERSAPASTTTTQSQRTRRRSDSQERRRQPRSRVRSSSRERHRSRSRRRSSSRDRRHRSQSRRSQSRRRRRSRSVRRQRDRSSGRGDRGDREREHHQQQRQRDSRYTERERERDRTSHQRTETSGSSSRSANRSRVVISAPPKLKKLVDY